MRDDRLLACFTLTMKSTLISPSAGISTFCGFSVRSALSRRGPCENELDDLGLLGLEIVVDVGGDEDLVGLHEEPRRPAAGREGSWRSRPPSSLPQRVPWPIVHARTFQAVRFSGIVERDLGGPIRTGRDVCLPEGGIGKVRPDRRLDHFRPPPATAPSSRRVAGRLLHGRIRRHRSGRHRGLPPDAGGPPWRRRPTRRNCDRGRPASSSGIPSSPSRPPRRARQRPRGPASSLRRS